MTASMRTLLGVVALCLAPTGSFAQSEAPGPTLSADCAETTDPLLRIEACTKLIKGGALEEPGLATAHTNRGLAYERLERFDKALSDYSLAIELNPSSAVAHNNRGNVHAAMGNLESALADHSRAIEIDPDYAFAYFNRGVDLEELGRFDEAIADYTATLEREPGYVVALVSRGTLHCRVGNLAEAEADLLAAIDRGAIDARAIQRRLRDQGLYRGGIDGVFGPGSQAALRAWVAEGCPSG